MADKDFVITEYDDFIVTESDGSKTFHSTDGLSNYIFNKKTGLMVSWGKTEEDDPESFPAPNILDLEVTTICRGINGKVCPFCYKSNTCKGDNMSFDTFKRILAKLPKSITQIAFGADSTLQSNPDIFKMMEYSRNMGYIPNVTLAQVPNDEVADNLARLCGAVAISRYDDKDVCYDSIKMLTDRGMTQVNMHYMIAEETYDRCLETLHDIATDSRLSKLNAIVLLSLKQKGRGTTFHPLSQDKFTKLCNLARQFGIGIGFDSCSSLKVFRAYDDERIHQCIIPCESTLESSYINVHGDFYPCSFCEGEKGWETGLSVLDCDDFVRDVWNNERTEQFRNKLLATRCNNEFGCRNCPMFNV